MSRSDGRRVLIVSRDLALLRGHYEGVIGRLVDAGVQVSIRYLSDSALSAEEYRATLADASIKARVAASPRPERRPVDVLSLRLRELGNILRFSHPDYAGRDVLSERAFEKKGRSAQRWGRRMRRLGPRTAPLAARAIAWLESTLPAPRYAVALLDEERPDAVAVVAVIRAPSLVDFLKAGAADGAATAIWVQSWDNLTNKGLLHFNPDRVFVWNERQKEELARYHGVTPERVCATGAQTFDHWFEGPAPPDRAEFCARLEIDSEKPIVLYLSSSRQIAPQEPDFFVGWLQALRQSGNPALGTATVLVRPHPTMVGPWYAKEFDREPGVVLSPATKRDQLNSTGFREQYRGELHHATLAVGINTSGLIDAAIFGKPACTVEVPELFHGQQGTVHFQHLARPDGGLLHTSRGLEAHMAMLGELIRRDTYAHDERSDAFVAAFVRPRGLDSKPTEVFAGEMLQLCDGPTRVAAPTGFQRGIGSTVTGVAAVVGPPLINPPLFRKRLRKRVRSAPRVLARRLLHSPVGAVLRRVLPRPVRTAMLRAAGMPRPEEPAVPGRSS